MALNGKWLFAMNGVNIDSFLIASNGALKHVDAYTAGSSGGGPANVSLIVRRDYVILP
jgi:shikimate kinase